MCAVKQQVRRERQIDFVYRLFDCNIIHRYGGRSAPELKGSMRRVAKYN